MKVVIIGSGAGGLTAASNIKKYSDNSDITVVTLDSYVAYSPCAIPYVIGGEIDSFNEIVMHTPEYYNEQGIKIITNSKVFDIDAKNNIVRYKAKDNTIIKEFTGELHYDYLIIATGGIPFIPPVDGTDMDGVFKVRTIDDGEKIKNWAENCKKAVIVGAGAIGLELGYGLKQIGIDVTITEMLPQIFPRSLDPDMALLVQKYLEGTGVKIGVNKALTKISGHKKAELVNLGEEAMDTDMVILSTGVKPSIELGSAAGCEIGDLGIKVNEHMQTSIPNIYAVGDCVEVYDAITGQNTLSPFGTTAVRQGKVASKNICGRKNSVFRPVLNSVVSKIGELEIRSRWFNRNLCKTEWNRSGHRKE